MQYRHELKHEISYADMLAIQSRLDAVAKADPHAIDGCYLIRSLYFDNMSDKALREKLSGVSNREKYRIRYYNGNTGRINLERKTKKASLGYKDQCPISSDECQRLLDGDYSWMPGSGRNLITDLYIRMNFDCIRPTTIVDYTRRPYIFEAGNVRVTFDYQIRTTTHVDGFLDACCPTLTVPDNPIIMEVKWDNFLPDVISDCVQTQRCRETAYSKYAASRMYD